jgi:hypothetical protein
MLRNENEAFREQLLALMAAPIPDYSADLDVASRVGKLLSDRANDRSKHRRLRPNGAQFLGGAITAVGCLRDDLRAGLPATFPDAHLLASQARTNIQNGARNDVQNDAKNSSAAEG